MLYGCPIAPARPNARGIRFAGPPIGCRPSMRSTVCAGRLRFLNAIAVFLDNLVPGAKKSAPTSQAGQNLTQGGDLRNVTRATGYRLDSGAGVCSSAILRALTRVSHTPFGIRLRQPAHRPGCCTTTTSRLLHLSGCTVTSDNERGHETCTC